MMDVRSNELHLNDVLPYAGKIKRQGKEYVGKCPCCGDTHHLYMTEKENKLLVYCQKCNARGVDILKAFRAMGAKPAESVADMPKTIIEEIDHEYKNPDGTVAYIKHRKKWSDGTKKFTFWHLDGGKKVYTKPESCNNLYNLDLMANTSVKTIYIVEGEKCADAMVKNGLLATTSNVGAQKNIKLSDTDKELLNSFENIILIPDNDEKGADYAKAWPMAKILPITEIWADCPKKGDVADFFQRGGSADAIKNYKWPVELTESYIDNLDQKSIISREFFEAVFAIQEFDRRQWILDIAGIRAKKISMYKELQRNWKAFLIAKAAKNQTGPGNLTKFFGQPLQLRCGEWIANDKGIHRETMHINGDGIKTEWASPIPVMPSEILTNVEDGTEKLRISFSKDAAWRSFVVPRGIAASSSKIIELANLGLEVNSENSKSMVKYIADCVAKNPDILPKTKSIGHMGWHNADFLPYCDDLKLDCEDQYKTVINAVGEMGTLDEWIKFVKPLRKNIFLKLIMGASFASPLIEKVNALPFVLHLWGGTGSGKTAGAMVAASIWGNPVMGGMVRTMNMTVNSMMATAAVLRNIPFIGDELQTIKSRFENYDQLIMRVCEGVDRGRMNNVILQRQNVWNNAFIFTGEEPCTMNDSGGGVKNRVIEIECCQKIIEDGNATVNFVLNHFGCAGKAYINAVLAEKELSKQYQGFFKQVMDGCGTTEKQAMAMALIMFGDAIAETYIFKTFDYLEIKDIKPFVKSVAEIDTAERSFTIMMDVIAANKNKFETLSYEPVGSEIWGKIIYDNDDILINKTILERELNNMGFSFSAVKKDWADKGYLALNSQGRYVQQTSVAGVKGSFIQIRTKPKTEEILT